MFVVFVNKFMGKHSRNSFCRFNNILSIALGSRMILSGLKGSFFLIVVAATILTVFAFFTPGWRFYNHEDNEGLVINHYGAVRFFIL